MHDGTCELLKRREGFIAHVEASLGEVQFNGWFLLSFSGRLSVGILSLQFVEALDVSAVSIESDTTSANLVDMEVELGKGRLLLHQHHGSPLLLHHFELLLLLAHLLLVLELDLVIALEFLLCVASLQVEFDIEIAGMRFNDLLLAIAFFFSLRGFELSHALAPLLGL